MSSYLWVTGQLQITEYLRVSSHCLEYFVNAARVMRSYDIKYSDIFIRNHFKVSFSKVGCGWQVLRSIRPWQRRGNPGQVYPEAQQGTCRRAERKSTKEAGLWRNQGSRNQLHGVLTSSPSPSSSQHSPTHLQTF